jgi:hypothetical protein
MSSGRRAPSLPLHLGFIMRPTFTAIAVLALTVLLAVSTAGAQSTSKRGERSCPVEGRHTLVADPQAEIYEAEGRLEKERVACAYATGHPYALGPKPEYTSSGGGGIERETLAGHFVAYENFAVGEYDRHWDVVVQNLWTGKTRRISSQGGFVSALVMKPSGAAAWIVNTEGGPEFYGVVVSDTTGTRVVANGSTIAPKSLALAGSTLYWTENGHPASTVLH